MIRQRRNYPSLFLLLICTLLIGLVAPTGCASPAPTSSVSDPLALQEENSLPNTTLQTKQSIELADNHIGGQWDSFYTVGMQNIVDAEILPVGLKRVRLAIDSISGDTIDWSKPRLTFTSDPDAIWSCAGDSDTSMWGKPELTVEPSHDDIITRLADNGVAITYVLTFWDKAIRGEEGKCPRFQTEGEIQRYLEFVRLIVQHFKDRVQYFEIWNEPDIKDSCAQSLEVDDYINLTKRAIYVIRQEYPEAKITVGSTTTLFEPESWEYLFSILSSDIMPLVDAVSWHVGGLALEHEFWQENYDNYPSLVQEIKTVASSHGFNGEYVADELTYWTHSDTICAKYYARGIILNLGMDVTVGLAGTSDEQAVSSSVIRNLCTIMAGAKPISMPVEIQSEATNIKSYGFSLPDGDRLLALWRDGAAIDEDPGTSATVISAGFLAQKVTSIDILNSFEQQIETNTENGSLIIRNLLVKDYPIILRLTP